MKTAIHALLLASLCACAAPGQSSDPIAAPVDAIARTAKPNVVFILTDDLSWNLVRYMPHVREMQQRGLTFTRYFVTDSLCCPSRSSIFTGKFPHDTGVLGNTGPTGGYPQFRRRGNATQTFAVAVAGAGYKTAMLGKYLNGYDPTKDAADPGWSDWAVSGHGYDEFDYPLNENGSVFHYGYAAKDYLTDVVSGLGRQFIHDSAASPFLLEIATFAPHSPYTPAPRDVGTMHERVPRTPAFRHANQHPPKWLAAYPALDQTQIDRLDEEFNLRAEAVQAVDRMIGDVFATLKAEGIADNTYVIFSSDNGYHMGDHMLPAGKETAFDTDIRVPLVVVGPGVPAGATDGRIVENIDLCPTFAELAGTAAPATAEGRSLVPLFQGQDVTDWRDFALVEHAGNDKAPMTAGDPDMEMAPALQPTTYDAIRTRDAVFVEYADGETEYYNLEKDPYELTNTAASLSPIVVTRFEKAIAAIKSCHTADDCWRAQHAP